MAGDSLKRYVLVPGLLEVVSNAGSIPGFLTPLYSSPAEDPAEVSLTFKVAPQATEPTAGGVAFGFIRGEPDGDDVAYDSRLLGPWGARLRLRGLQNGPELSVSGAYAALARVRVGNLLPPGEHLSDVAQVKLLQGGRTLVHAASAAIDGKGVLLAGPGGSGKTATVMGLVDRGAAFLAEDVSITDGERLWGLPRTRSCLWDADPRGLPRAKQGQRLAARLFRGALALSPAAGLILPPPSAGSLPRDRVETQAPLRFVFVLGRGPGKFEPLPAREALRRLLLINRYEFSWYENPLLVGYAALNRWLDLGGLMRQEEKVLAEATRNAECFLCQAPEPAEMVEPILSVVKDERAWPAAR
ncbi:MAG: hypothetical protein HYS09_01415 [Chloroflexi bacterium]|nr:hypothetical protein [Chloroflexota bacterium]